ncbi:OmpA family protein [Cellvibrio sp.]|uniref:OmpA family protein n=1 Tax=Cellvibrio sp. TaxID=1965322 RepID=UPI0039647CB0
MNITIFLKNVQKLGIPALLLIGAPNYACADYFYAGGLVGQAQGQVGADEMNQRMESLGYMAQAKVDGQNRSVWALYGGYQYSQYLSVEFGYVDLGTVRTRLSGSPVDIQDYLNSANLVHPRSASGYEFALLGTYPIDEKNSVYLRGGMMFATSRYRATSQTDFAKRLDDDKSAFIGIGYQYELNDRWGLRATYESYRVENERIGVYGVGLRYKFISAQRQINVPINVPTPAQVQQIATTAPAAPAVPDCLQNESQPNCERKSAAPLSIKLEVQFDTASATVKESFTHDIDELARFLTKNPSAKVTIEGHTDNQGNSEFNKTLSLQRAQSVQNILVSKYGVARERITAVGFGAEKPIGDNATPEGRAQNRRVMAEIK